MQSSNILLENLKVLAKRNYVKENPGVLKMLRELEMDIQKNFYTVVVLGEFKRGKSTFVNALLGTPLLPTDILPETATINAIMFNEEPKISVVTVDGEKEGEATADFLKKFSAQVADEKFLNEIRYIKVGYPLEILKNRIVLVDTPGVADLSAQRAEITRQFIPKANTVIFLLDANSPLKKTEKDFIENNLLPLGITDILFLLNKYDEVDEEEDSDLLDDVRKKLANAFNVGKENSALKKIECLPVSALDALNGMIKKDKKLVELSGINEVRDKLNEMLSASKIELKKQLGYKRRLNFILNYLTDYLTNIRAVKLADSAELQKAIAEIETLITEQTNNEIKIDNYTTETKKKIFAMTDKSIRYFHQKLEEEICEAIENYSHENFKEFVEGNITKSVKKNFETWIMLYAPAIEKMLLMLETELSRGLSYHFKQKIKISTQAGKFNLGDFSINFFAEDVSNVSLKAGAVAAAGSIGLMAIVGAGILPLVGFVAAPYLKKKFLKERLAQAKISLIPEVKNTLSDSIFKMQEQIHDYIDNRCDTIVKNTKFAYEKILNDTRSILQKEIEDKKSADFNSQKAAEKIKSDIDEINSFRVKI